MANTRSGSSLPLHFPQRMCPIVGVDLFTWPLASTFCPWSATFRLPPNHRRSMSWPSSTGAYSGLRISPSKRRTTATPNAVHPSCSRARKLPPVRSTSNPNHPSHPEIFNPTESQQNSPCERCMKTLKSHLCNAHGRSPPIRETVTPVTASVLSK